MYTKKKGILVGN